MLVEGGYVHSMKRLMEKAEQQQPSQFPPRPPRRPPNLVKRSLARLARLLRMQGAS